MRRRMKLDPRAKNHFQIEERQDSNERRGAEVQRNGMREQVIL